MINNDNNDNDNDSVNNNSANKLYYVNTAFDSYLTPYGEQMKLHRKISINILLWGIIPSIVICIIMCFIKCGVRKYIIRIDDNHNNNVEAIHINENGHIQLNDVVV